MTGIVPGYSCVGHMFNVKNVTLEPINDSVPSLTYKLNVAKIKLLALNEIIALTCAIPYGVVSFVIT